MTKAIASYPVEKREAVVLRRIRNGSGVGYHTALAAAAKMGLNTPATYVSKKRWDKGQKKAGQDFAKAMAQRAKLKQLHRKPSIKNNPRVKRG